MAAPEQSLREKFIANVTGEVEARNMQTPSMVAFLEHIGRMGDETFEHTALPIIARMGRNGASAHPRK